jgi:cell division protein FtsX
MDENKLLDELKRTIKEGQQSDSKLTITWAAVITILVLLFTGLFTGYFTNATRITKLESDFKYTIETVVTLKNDQKQALELLTEIRFDQRRREKKEEK